MSKKLKQVSKFADVGDFKLTGTEKWVNQKTGEVKTNLTAEIDASDFKETRPNFMICVLSYILKLTDLVGNKKMQVVNYILNNMSKKGDYSNTLLITQRELAKKSDVSLQTVSVTLKELEKANIIKKRTGAIMLHPDLAMVGDGGKRKGLLIQFKNFGNDEDDQ